MSLKHGLLGLLSCEGPTTGYELDKFFKDSLANFWQAKTSQIYRELNAMENQGWLTSKRVMQEEKPNKRVYSLTEEGRAELINWLTSPHDFLMAGGAKSEFLMRLFFSGEVGKESAIKLIRDFRDLATQNAAIINQAQKDMVSEEAGYTKHIVYWKLAALSGEISYRAGIEWANQAIEILENMGE